MPDFLDSVQARVDAAREDAIRAALRRQPAAGAEAATHCADCGDEIPPARQDLVEGVNTCVECQNLRERRGR